MGTCFRFEPLAVAKAATETVFSLSFCFLLLGRACSSVSISSRTSRFLFVSEKLQPFTSPIEPQRCCFTRPMQTVFAIEALVAAHHS